MLLLWGFFLGGGCIEEIRNDLKGVRLEDQLVSNGQNNMLLPYIFSKQHCINSFFSVIFLTLIFHIHSINLHTIFINSSISSGPINNNS